MSPSSGSGPVREVPVRGDRLPADLECRTAHCDRAAGRENRRPGDQVGHQGQHVEDQVPGCVGHLGQRGCERLLGAQGRERCRVRALLGLRCGPGFSGHPSTVGDQCVGDRFGDGLEFFAATCSTSLASCAEASCAAVFSTVFSAFASRAPGLTGEVSRIARLWSPRFFGRPGSVVGGFTAASSAVSLSVAVCGSVASGLGFSSPALGLELLSLLERRSFQQVSKTPTMMSCRGPPSRVGRRESSACQHRHRYTCGQYTALNHTKNRLPTAHPVLRSSEL